MRSETTATATALSAGAIGGSGGDVFDAADLHAGTGEGAESGLCTGAGSLGTVATLLTSLARTISGTFGDVLQ